MQEFFKYTLVTIGIINAWFAKEEYIFHWPISITTTLISSYFFIKKKLYHQVIGNLIAVLFSLYGWYRWSQPQADGQPLPITFLSMRHFWSLLPLFAMNILFFYWLLTQWESHYPFVGALQISFVFLGMWLSANKIWESYVVWIVVNIINIGFNYSVKNYPFVVRYLFYLFLSCKGSYDWFQRVDNQ